MRRLILPVAALLIITGAFAWWWSRPERVLTRRVHGLFQSANVQAEAGTITRNLRGSAIEGYLASTVTLKGPDGPTEEFDGPRSRDSIVTLYSSLARYCRRVSLEKPEIDAISIDGNEASVKARVDAVIELSNESYPVDGIQNMTMEWRKTDGKWLLSSAEWTETGR